MRTARWSWIAVLTVCCVAPRVSLAQGTAPRNSHAVGYRSLTVTDSGRHAVNGTAARTIPAFIWYPAAAGGRRAETFGRWIDQLAEAAGAPKAGDSIFVSRAAELGGNRDSIANAVLKLRQLATASAANAPPAAGRFPLIVFPEYSAPATTSILAEQLASRGYVVVSIPLLGTFTPAPDISTRGLETMALDINTAIGRLRQLPFVDGRRVGAIGVGIAASALLASHLMSPNVKALVSLEGGITTAFEIEMIRRSPFFDPARVRAPLLAITAPHASVDAKRLDIYPYAPQLRLHYAAMGEFWFLNYGWLDQYLPGIIGQPPGNPLPGFQSAMAVVGRFFDATLRQSRELSLDVAGIGPEFVASWHPARSTPPDASSLLQLYRANGTTGLMQRLEQRRTDDPAILPATVFAELVNGVAPTDTRWTARSAIATLWIEGHPQSAQARRAAALAALGMLDSVTARTHVTAALNLVNDDPDVTLESESLRRNLIQQLRTLADRLNVVR